MKVAIVTDDGTSISAHFGRAPAYAVLTVEDGVVVAREMRAKSAPHRDRAAGHVETGSHDDPAANARHDDMIAPIADCTYLVARGMGRGAYDRIVAAGIRPIVTKLVVLDQAALECAAGSIVNLEDQLH